MKCMLAEQVVSEEMKNPCSDAKVGKWFDIIDLERWVRIGWVMRMDYSVGVRFDVFDDEGKMVAAVCDMNMVKTKVREVFNVSGKIKVEMR